MKRQLNGDRLDSLPKRPLTSTDGRVNRVRRAIEGAFGVKTYTIPDHLMRLGSDPSPGNVCSGNDFGMEFYEGRAIWLSHLCKDFSALHEFSHVMVSEPWRLNYVNYGMNICELASARDLRHEWEACKANIDLLLLLGFDESIIRADLLNRYRDESGLGQWTSRWQDLLREHGAH